MAKTHRTAMRPRMWRWRRNPLRRGSDIAEAWVLLLAWALAVLGGPAAGLVTGGATWQALVRENAGRHAVEAVVSDSVTARSRGAHGTWMWATVRWTAPDGAVHTDRALMPSSASAGTRVRVWTDRQGRQTSAPLASSAVAAQAASTGVLAAAGAAGAVLVGTLAVRATLDRRRMRQWAEEWERANPWRGRKTG